MKCQRCQSERVIAVCAKCSDCCGVNLGSSSMEGYVPTDLGIGGGDYIEFNLCLECGQLQGKFPQLSAAIEKDCSDAEVKDFYDNYFTEGERIKKLSYENKSYLEASLDDLGPKFKKFLNDFLDFNSSKEIRYDSATKYNYPSSEKFVQMYRDNNPNLGNDW